jgi:hypothetical protein
LKREELVGVGGLVIVKRVVAGVLVVTVDLVDDVGADALSVLELQLELNERRVGADSVAVGAEHAVVAVLAARAGLLALGDARARAVAVVARGVDPDGLLRQSAAEDVDVLHIHDRALAEQAPARISLAPAKSLGLAARGAESGGLEREELAELVVVDVEVIVRAHEGHKRGAIGAVVREVARVVAGERGIKDRTSTNNPVHGRNVHNLGVAALLTHAVLLLCAKTNADLLPNLGIVAVETKDAARAVNANHQVLLLLERVAALAAANGYEREEGGELRAAAAADRAPLVGIALGLGLDLVELGSVARGAVRTAGAAADGLAGQSVDDTLVAALVALHRGRAVGLAELELKLAPLEPVVEVRVLGVAAVTEPVDPVLVRVILARERGGGKVELAVLLPVAVVDATTVAALAPANVRVEVDPVAVSSRVLEQAELGVLEEVVTIVLHLAAIRGAGDALLRAAVQHPRTLVHVARVGEAAIHGVDGLIRERETSNDTSLGLEPANKTVSEARVGLDVVGAGEVGLGNRFADIELLERRNARRENEFLALGDCNAVALDHKVEIVAPAIGAVRVVNSGGGRLLKLLGVNKEPRTIHSDTAVLQTELGGVRLAVVTATREVDAVNWRHR